MYGSKVRFNGKVLGLTAGTGSALSVLPAQNASGNWIKIVQRLPVRIGLDPQELEKHPLFLGLSTTVAVDVHDQSGAALSQTPAWPATLDTNVYLDQDAGADAAISEIVAANLGRGAAAAATVSAQRGHP
jgi:membrane fusion protein, multidrug efflux system